MATSTVKWASTELHHAGDARLSQPFLGVKKSALKKPKVDAHWSSQDTEQQTPSGRWKSRDNGESTARNTNQNTPKRPRDEQSLRNGESTSPRNTKQSTSKRPRDEQGHSTGSEESPPRKRTLIRRASKGSKKREILAEGAVVRYDSDDELGLVDHPWEWIYAERPKPDGPKKKKRRPKKPAPEQIVGAKSGSFSCRVGEVVFMKGLVSGEAWVGIICNFEEDENEEKCVNVMWFTTEREMEHPEKKLMDYMPNELYITPFGDFNPLTCINGRATIVSPRAFLQKYPDGIVPLDSEDFGKLFVCRRGVNQKRTIYTDEFVWEDVYSGFQDLEKLFEMVEDQTTVKPNSRRKYRKHKKVKEGQAGDKKQREEENGKNR